ncbi:CHAD domain-containing protein [Ornithinimicrobium sp. LYQ121]|uniref:CYTH and CHAD domain-containing protein n=1 Tax=Ornithinimicrobium sp. LYQ121 TaxID=3378801 RepID=UPI00385186A7
MRQLETERKFEIEQGAPLPGLAGLVQVGEAREHRMRAAYVDTPDLLLVRHRMTLRHREGGGDEGWHLKLPHDGSTRLEIHAPLGEGPGRLRVPEGHRAEVARALGDAWPTGAAAALLPAAVLSTHRVEVDLLDDGGVVVAQLCDDTVTALPAGQTWRELEVELVGGDEDLLDAITARLEDQGIQVSDSPSKLSRALGDRPDRAARGEGPTPQDPAADVLHAYLAAQLATILGREDDVRNDVPDAVHKVRVATRRLRSALRTFRRVLRRETTDPLRDELRWLGEMLGGPRDAEVMRERILAGLDGLPERDVRGPVRERVATELDRRHDEAHRALVAALDSDRHLELTDRLVELLAEPPWRARARKKARRVMPALVAEASALTDREWAAAQTEEDAEQRLHLQHETRKRAKAVRYAWEALAPAFGDDAVAAAARWEQVTESLGGVQDSVVAIGWLRELADLARAAGEETFTYGVLVGRAEEQRVGLVSTAESAFSEAGGLTTR